jgi:hypothetical protein
MAGAARYFTDNHDKVGGSQVAVISAHPEHFMHGRQLQYALRSRNSGVNVQIFYDVNEALEWLRHMSNGQSRPMS